MKTADIQYVIKISRYGCQDSNVVQQDFCGHRGRLHPPPGFPHSDAGEIDPGGLPAVLRQVDQVESGAAAQVQGAAGRMKLNKGDHLWGDDARIPARISE
jgi:hypothetical protein